MFANKVVVITGASAGIGAATAEVFAKAGAALTIVGRNETALSEVSQRCKNHGSKVLTVKAEVTKEEEVKSIVKNTIDKFGKIDVLVNNAASGKIASITDSNILEVYDEVLNVNLRSLVHLTHLAVPYLKETKGNIVNISSIAGFKVFKNILGPYSVSKAAVNHFTRATAIELSPFGVRVNCITPGPVMTQMLQDSIPNFDQNIDFILKSNLLGRISDPEEIADLIVYLASDKARGITGSCIVSDNGVLLK